MGFLYCMEMSKALVDHLQAKGPISVKAAAELYWRKHPKGYCTDDEDHKTNATMALGYAALVYCSHALIEPMDRRDCYSMGWLQDSTNITAEELEWFATSAPLMEYNQLIVLFNDEDLDGNYIWFDAIVWKLSDKALADPSIIGTVEGVDL